MKDSIKNGDALTKNVCVFEYNYRRIKTNKDPILNRMKLFYISYEIEDDKLLLTEITVEGDGKYYNSVVYSFANHVLAMDEVRRTAEALSGHF